jgi:hypothetical protein
MLLTSTACYMDNFITKQVLMSIIKILFLEIERNKSDYLLHRDPGPVNRGSIPGRRRDCVF